MAPPIRKNDLEVMIEDKDHIAVQVGSGILTVDGSSQASPISYGAAPIPITIPNNAVEFIVNPSTDMRISEDPSMTSYDVIRGNTKESIPVGRTAVIYILRDSGGGTLNFRFTIV